MQIFLLPALLLCSKSSMENRLPHLPCSVVVLCDPDVYRGICLPVIASPIAHTIRSILSASTTRTIHPSPLSPSVAGLVSLA